MGHDALAYRMYGDLAAWWPLISPPERYAEEAAFTTRVIQSAAIPVGEVLELGSGGGHSASAISANGLVYFVSDRGITTVVRPGPKFEVVAKNDLKELVSSSPAISQGQFFIRGQKNLYCIGEKVD